MKLDQRFSRQFRTNDTLPGLPIKLYIYKYIFVGANNKPTSENLSGTACAVVTVVYRCVLCSVLNVSSQKNYLIVRIHLLIRLIDIFMLHRKNFIVNFARLARNAMLAGESKMRMTPAATEVPSFEISASRI